MAKRWTSSDDDRLRQQYDAGMAVRTIADQLDRSEDAVVARRRALGLVPRHSPPRWRPLEDELLRSATIAAVPATVVAERLRRPVEQVRARRRQLGLGKPAGRKYSAEEDAALREHWGDADLTGLAHRLGRSPDSLRLRAQQLGLHHPRSRPRWTAAEDDTLRDGYANGETCLEIARSLPGRTPTAVSARALALGLATYARRWSDADDDRLKHVLSGSSVAEAARVLGRTPEGVRRRAQKLDIPTHGQPADARADRWSTREDELLRMHANLNPATLALLLGRSDRAVSARLRRLGLRIGRERSPHHPAASRRGLTPGERQVLERHLDRAGPRAAVAAATRLGLPLQAVRELTRLRSTPADAAAELHVASG